MSTSPSLLLQRYSASSAGGLDAAPIRMVVIHPLVLFSVLDHHSRRPEGADRVIGTLLGRREGDLVEITNCFAVPHAEEGTAEQGYDVSIGKDFNRQMLVLHRRTNRSENVMGWYATTPQPNNNNTTIGLNPTDDVSRIVAVTSVPLHEFYADECEYDPIHLVVDTSLVTDSIPLYAFRTTSVSIQGELVGNVFHAVRLALKSVESEKIAVDSMIRSQKQSTTNILMTQNGDDLPNVSEELCVTMEKFLSLIDTTSMYVNGVQSGEIRGDDVVGRKIADAITSLPRIRPERFDKMFNSTLQDLLMVTYLMDITKTQIGIAEKLNAILDKNV